MGRAIELATDLPFVRVLNREFYDFAFRQISTDMMGEEKGIPPGALVLCESRSFRNCISYDQRFNVADTRLAVVSVLGNTMIREVHFIGGVLRLLSWNSKCDAMAFPMDAEALKQIKPADNPLCPAIQAKDVDIFGIADKVVFDV